MKKVYTVMAVIAAAAVGVFASVALASESQSASGGAPGVNPGEQAICNGGDSGKIDTSGDPSSVTVTAPEGFLISGYCVKGGQTTDNVDLDEPVKTLVITVSTGEDVSHWSVNYVKPVTPPPPGTVEVCQDGVVGTFPEGTEDDGTCDVVPPPPPPPPPLCPDGKPPTPGEGAFDPNDDCKRPPVTPPVTPEPPVTPPVEPPVTPPVVPPVTPENPVTPEEPVVTPEEPVTPERPTTQPTDKPSKAPQEAPATS